MTNKTITYLSQGLYTPARNIIVDGSHVGVESAIIEEGKVVPLGYRVTLSDQTQDFLDDNPTQALLAARRWVAKNV